MLRLLEDEQKEENKREMQLNRITDKQEQKRLGKIYSEEKGKASQRIDGLSKKHEKEVVDLANNSAM